jgi:hypothetical protein
MVATTVPLKVIELLNVGINAPWLKERRVSLAYDSVGAAMKAYAFQLVHFDELVDHKMFPIFTTFWPLNGDPKQLVVGSAADNMPQPYKKLFVDVDVRLDFLAG